MKKETYLRISYWWGAIADMLLGIEMITGAFLGSSSPFIGLGMTIEGGVEYRYAMSIAAIFMLTWTILLVWADRKPLERKDILLILVPIIIGLRLSVLLGYNTGLLSIERVIFDTTLSLLYLLIILVSYSKARS
ncbi:MAG: hypothetical protein ACFFAS_21295 [Promethearchaeota archaeon]